MPPGIGYEVGPLLDAIRDQYSLVWNGLHGVAHWARVFESALRIADETAATSDVLLLFALFHDSCLVNDHIDPEHGKRGAELAASYRGRYFEVPDREFDLLYYACEAHTNGLIDADPLVQVCWDADRLDLKRAGIAPKPGLLCINAAKDPQVISWASQRAGDRFVPSVVTAEWGQSS